MTFRPESFFATDRHATFSGLTPGRSYDEQYEWLLSQADVRSGLEPQFLEHLHHTGRNLPDEAQVNIEEAIVTCDFYYRDQGTCVFCDGGVHDEPQRKVEDEQQRRHLRELGYRVIVIRYDRDLEEQMAEHTDVFGEGKARG